MPITFQCDCGRKFRTAEENAGRSATCPDCRIKLIVPPAEAETALPVVEEAEPQRPAYNAESVEVTPTPRRAAEPRPYDRPRRDNPYGRIDDYDRKRPSYRSDDIRNRIVKRPSSSSGGMTGAGVLAGLAMMVGALIWFFGGMMLNIYFIYPPFLFIAGLVCFIKGLASGKL